VDISLVPYWLRLFFILFVILFFLVKMAPILLRVLGLLSKKLLYLVTYPVTLLICKVLKNGRNAGKMGIPVWVQALEGSFALCEKCCNILIELTEKRRRSSGSLKKLSFPASLALAAFLTAAIIQHPTKWSASAKTEFVLNAPYDSGGNIREAPSLAAPRLYTITAGEAVDFLNESQVDASGIKWLKVKTANGRVEGWISSRIVKEAKK
jgi:hypothetical protein